MKLLSVLFLSCFLLSNAEAQKVFTGKPQYRIDVQRQGATFGSFVVELFPAIAPMAVENFDSLVAIKFYDSTAFHRVIPAFMIQGGDPNSRSGPISTWGMGSIDQATVDAEFNAVSHQRGILSAARASDPNSATSQFFVCVTNDSYLDHQYTAYGRVVSGMNIVDTIVNAPRDATDHPLSKISMFVSYLGSNDSLPGIPKLLSPANDTSLISTTQSLKWSKVSSGMIYHLQVATDPSYTTLVIDSDFNQIDTIERMTKLAKTTYYWHVNANNGGHISDYSPTSHFRIGTSGVTSGSSTTLLQQSYPNPTVASATITFELPNESRVTLRILDMQGREVRTLIDAPLGAGEHHYGIWKGMLSPGEYLYELKTESTSETRKLTIE